MWYIRAARWVFVFGLLIGIVLFATLQAYANSWLSRWTNDYANETVTVSQHQVHKRLAVYGTLALGQGKEGTGR